MIRQEREGHQVRLCWRAEKFVAGIFYLHEGPGETGEAGTDQPGKREKRDRERAQAFPEMAAEGTDDGGDGVFIDTGLLLKDLPVTGRFLITPGNGRLHFQGDLGVRDDRGKEERMGMMAGAAEDPGDP